MTPLQRRCALPLVVALCSSTAGCGFEIPLGPVSIIFTDSQLDDRTAFNVSSTGFAVYDQHETVTDADGATTIRQRQEPRVLLFLSGATFDPEEDLAALSAEEMDTLVNDVRRADLALVTELPASRLGAGGLLTSEQPSGRGDFVFQLQRGPGLPRRNPTFADRPPLGSRQAATVTVARSDLRDQGRISIQPMDVELKRGEEQTQQASTGRISIQANLPIIPERLGESNLVILRRALLP